MKKSVLSVVILCLGFVVVKPVKAKVDEGSFLIDVFYGSPSIASLLLIAAVDGNVDKSIHVGPMGIRGEYMLSDRIGLAGELSVSSFLLEARDENNNFYSFSQRRIRFMPKFNYHFGAGDRIDSYLSIGTGYRNTIREIVDENDMNTKETGRIPLTMRVSWGLRVFLTERFAFNGDLGFGGGYTLSGGLTFKLK